MITGYFNGSYISNTGLVLVGTWIPYYTGCEYGSFYAEDGQEFKDIKKVNII